MSSSSSICAERAVQHAPQHAQHSPPRRTLPALASGAIQAVLFNPVDRALYVRVKFRRATFLDKRNFERPFQGFMNSAVYRTLVGSSYVFWQDTFQVFIEKRFPPQCQADARPQLNAAIVGLLAGMFNGLALNAMQTVKFRMWTSDERYITFMKTAKLLYSEGGSAMFFRGCWATMLRDSVFGVVYEMTRRSATLLHAYNSLFYCTQPACQATGYTLLHTLASDGKNGPGGSIKNDNGNDSEGGAKASASLSRAKSGPVLQADAVLPTRCSMSAFVLNMVAAVVASIVSAPLNYARVIIYGTPFGAVPLGYVKLLRSFFMQCAYIYRHGKSYYETHSASPSSSARAPTTQSSPSSSSNVSHSGDSSERTRDKARCHRSGIDTNSECTPSLPQSRPIPAVTQNVAYVPRSKSSHTTSMAWSRRSGVHMPRGSDAMTQRHWAATWRWANSRLNVGWGSLRVGLGMAIGQLCFYMVQDVLQI